jgi:hypothetical protein
VYFMNKPRPALSQGCSAHGEQQTAGRKENQDPDTVFDENAWLFQVRRGRYHREHIEAAPTDELTLPERY